MKLFLLRPFIDKLFSNLCFQISDDNGTSVLTQSMLCHENDERREFQLGALRGLYLFMRTSKKSCILFMHK